jgi:hypothetical protein
MTKSTVSAIFAAALCVGSLSANAAGALPHASCRNGNVDRAESGMSGETTQAERDSGAAKLGFNCNTDLIGQYQGEGASWQITAWKNCAYFDQRNNAAEAHRGVVVVDVSNPSSPKPTKWLSDPSMIDPWESLKVNPARQLLAGDQLGQSGFSIYDISKDCTQPELLSAVVFPGSFGHTGQWAPDGKTYYITPLRASPSMVVVDTSDASNPKLIACAQGSYGCNAGGFFVLPAQSPGGAPLNPVFHDLEFSKDGNIAYITMIGNPFAAPPASPSVNGLLILDVSDFQQRRTGPGQPAAKFVSQLVWADGSRGAQNALPITVAGKPYILFSDEAGAGPSGCATGLSPSGFPRLIDISDPANPKTVSKMLLDVHDPANCSKIVTSPVTSSTTNPQGGFGYSCHYCNVDDIDNAKIAACSCFAAGLRFFDISNPANPREIAYYKAPGQGTKALAGSQYSGSAGAGFNKNYDWSTAKVSFPKDRGDTSGDIWATSQDNGFIVLRMDQGGGGCTSAEGSLGGLIALGFMHLFRRRKSARAT